MITGTTPTETELYATWRLCFFLYILPKK